MGTLDGNDLGAIETITFSHASNVIALPMPGEESEDTELFDLLGVTRIITIIGYWTGTIAQISAKIEAVRGLCNTEQTSTYDLVSDELNASGSIAQFEVTWEIPSNRAKYTIKLLEGTTI